MKLNVSNELKSRLTHAAENGSVIAKDILSEVKKNASKRSHWFCLREYACSTARESFPCICPPCSFCRERSSASSSGHSPSL